jgi:hypothetical protein
MARRTAKETITISKAVPDCTWTFECGTEDLTASDREASSK